MTDENTKDLQYVVKLQNEINKRQGRSLEDVQQSVDLDSLSVVLDLEKNAEPDDMSNEYAAFNFGEQLLNISDEPNDMVTSYNFHPSRPAMQPRKVLHDLIDFWKSNGYANDLNINVEGSGPVTDIVFDGQTVTLKSE